MMSRTRAIPSILGAAALLAALLPWAPPAHAATFVVDSTLDEPDARSDGVCNAEPEPGAPPRCTLRAAMEEAQRAAATHTIVFNIPGPGPHTIAPRSPLPEITRPLTIDGYTETGASPNTLADGNNAVLKIQLDGSLAGAGTHGLVLTIS